MSAKPALLRGRDFNKAQSEMEYRKEKQDTGDVNDTMKILFANIGGIPMEHTNNKNIIIEKWIGKSNADFIGIAETNICWRHSKNGSFEERLKKWTYTSSPQYQTNLQSSIAYNDLDPLSREYQIGGVALATRGGLSCRITDKGEDATKTGRWAWTDYRGQKGMKLRIVCAYRLVHTSNKGGPETMHAQHLRALYKLDRHEEPLQAFDNDFFMFLKSSKEDGYQLIVMMDANENLRNSNFAQRMKREGLRDHLSHQTYHKNVNSFHRGSTIIDGIFCSSNIVVTSSSYQSFDQSPGYHRGIEMELCLKSIFGTKNPHIKPRPPRRLHCKIRQSVKTYNSNLHKHIRLHNLDSRIQALKETVHHTLTEHQEEEDEEIDNLMVERMKQSEAKCRKLKISTTFETIYLIRLLMKKRRGGKVRTSLIRRTVEKIDLDKRELTKSFHESHYYKKNHVTHRKNWLNSQQSQMYDRGKINISSKLKAKQNREKKRRISSRIITVLRPFKSRGVTK